jgi:S-(hydroxymethyl)glutathione dehydrogenase/alcohol dehydrogenase
MKAAVLQSAGSPVALEELPRPRPRAEEVLVKVAACGICHSDLHVAKGELKFPTPCVLGHEISGVVEETGPGVRGFERGDRIVSSFILPCGKCVSCARGRDDLCEPFFAMNRGKGTLFDGETRLFRQDGTPLAMYSMGGLAEYAVVPATDVFRVPAHLPLPEACILGCAVMTAYGAVKHQAEVRPGDTVAVVGVGGVGTNVVQLSRLFGAAEVIAVDVRDDKLEEVRKLGATQTVNAARQDPVEEVRSRTGGRGADVAIEALGRPETILNAFLMTRDGGRTVVIGLGAGQAAASIEVTRLVRRSIRLTGSYGCRVRTDMPEIVALAARGLIDLSKPISRRYGLHECAQAYQALGRGEIVGRAIVVL